MRSDSQGSFKGSYKGKQGHIGKARVWDFGAYVLEGRPLNFEFGVAKRQHSCFTLAWWFNASRN